MPARLGTRTKSSLKYERLAQGNDTRGYTRDIGMTKRVTASLTFASAGATLTGANGTFTSTFAVNDPVWIEAGAVLNEGAFFTVTALDTVNAAYLVLDPPPKDEGPLTVTVRTP
jgi:hypothetical protein